jgi:hypothetical protein
VTVISFMLLLLIVNVTCIAITDLSGGRLHDNAQTKR